MGTHKRVTK